MELSIDTSTQYASVALSEEGRALWLLSWHSAQNHTVELAPAIELLLRKAGRTPAEIKAIIVAKGPGGFSALRVGMGFAKGMAAALGIPLVGVSTLEVEAYPYRGVGPTLCPLIGASRGEVAWALYRQGKGRWRQLMAERITTPEELASALPRRSLVCGEAATSLPMEVKALLNLKARVIELPPPTRSALTLASIGAQRLRQGEVDDIATLQPLYLRQPSISKPKELARVQK